LRLVEQGDLTIPEFAHPVAFLIGSSPHRFPEVTA
jgi:hypothetical protein